MAIMDTDRRSHDVLVDGFRRLTPETRLRMALRMSNDVRILSRTGIRHRHPEYSELDLDDALRVLLVGEDLFRRLFPTRRVLAP